MGTAVVCKMREIPHQIRGTNSANQRSVFVSREQYTTNQRRAFRYQYMAQANQRPVFGSREQYTTNQRPAFRSCGDNDTLHVDINT